MDRTGNARATRPAPQSVPPCPRVDVEDVPRRLRDAAFIAATAERALHHDPRYHDVRLRAGDQAGEIVASGRVGDPRLLALLEWFAAEWGSVRLAVEVVPAATPA